MRINHNIFNYINQNSSLSKNLFKMILKKKFFSIFFFFGLVNAAYKNQLNYCVYFFNNYILNLLKLLKYLNLIFNYYTVISANIKINRLVVVYFNNTIRKKQLIKALSSHSRYIYISVKKLHYLAKNNKKILFILNTSKGLMSHIEALKLNIGGQLLCSLRK